VALAAAIATEFLALLPFSSAFLPFAFSLLAGTDRACRDAGRVSRSPPALLALQPRLLTVAPPLPWALPAPAAARGASIVREEERERGEQRAASQPVY
jgi:hypothetical protein